MGTLGQCIGVAERLGTGGPSRVRRSNNLDYAMAAVPILSRLVHTELILSAGDAGERRARRLQRWRRPLLWAHIELPAPSGEQPDLIFVSHHDWRPEYAGLPAFRCINGVPHRFRRAALEAARPAARAKLAADERPTLACLIGGPNRSFSYDARTIAGVLDTIERFVRDGWLVAAIGSRRSDPRMILALQKRGHRNFRLLAKGDGIGYAELLAAADALMVTEDSISMACEALTSGRPVRLLALTAAAGDHLEKFRRFQHRFGEELGLLRFDDGSPIVTGGPLRPGPDDTAFVADTILCHLAA